MVIGKNQGKDELSNFYFKYFQITLIIFSLILISLFPLFEDNNQTDSGISDRLPEQQIDTNDLIVTPPSGTRESSRAFFDTWGMSGLDITNLDDPNNEMIYAGYRPYTFRFIVDDLVAFDNVTGISIEILDELQNFTWLKSRSRPRAENTHVTSSNRSSFTSSFYKISPSEGFLDFNITFGWNNFNNSGQHLCRVRITDEDSNISTTSVWKSYYLVNTVKFVGNLKADGEIQGLLQEYDWIMGQENVTWTGLRVIYDTTGTYIPPQNQCSIILDHNGIIHDDLSLPGMEMVIITQAGASNNFNDLYIFSVTGPAEDNLLSTIEFKLRVDSDGITFYNATPNQNIWQTTTNVRCIIFISDNYTSGVDQDSIEFKYSTDGGNLWSVWYKPKINDFNTIFECYSTIVFIDGSLNLIQWRGYDLVKNAYTYSGKYRILVDSTRLTFQNMNPTSIEIQYNTTIICTIEAQDETSGINASSIGYSFLLDGEMAWSAWKSLGLYENDNLIFCKTNLQFNYGSNNFIKWRANDIAGTGFVETEAFQIKVTHRIPKVYLISPMPGEIINVTKPTLQWNDSYEILQGVVYTLEFWPENDPGDITRVNLTKNTFTIAQALEYNTKYFWQVIPVTDDLKQIGICESGILNFTINTEAIIDPVYDFETRFFINEVVQIKPEETKNIEFIVFNKGNNDDRYNINILYDPIWENYIEYTSSIFVPIDGSANVTIKIEVPRGVNFSVYPIKIVINSTGGIDLNQSIEQSIIFDLEVVKEKKESRYEFGMFEWLIISLIIIIIIIFVIVLAVKSRSKIKRFESKFGKGKTIKGSDVEVVYEPELSKAVDMTTKEEGIPTSRPPPKQHHQQKPK